MEALAEREAALRRMNAAIDTELMESPVMEPSPTTPRLSMGSEAFARIHKAKEKGLREEAEAAVERERAALERCSAAEARATAADAEIKRLKRELATLRATHDKVVKAKTDAESAAVAAKRDAAAAERGVRDAKREATQVGSEQKARDVRLARALEDNDKLKAQLAKARSSLRDAADEARADRDRLDANVRKLERQKSELLAAFRKQLKLIDILKRQKVHMEAARLLAFTEDEFMKLVSWDNAAAPVTKKKKRPLAPKQRLVSSPPPDDDDDDENDPPPPFPGDPDVAEDDQPAVEAS